MTRLLPHTLPQFPIQDPPTRQALIEQDTCPECGGVLAPDWTCTECNHDALAESLARHGKA